MHVVGEVRVVVEHRGVVEGRGGVAKLVDRLPGLLIQHIRRQNAIHQLEATDLQADEDHGGQSQNHRRQTGHGQARREAGGFTGGGHHLRRRRFARRQCLRQRIAARQRRRHGQRSRGPLRRVGLEAPQDHALHGGVKVLHPAWKDCSAAPRLRCLTKSARVSAAKARLPVKIS